MSKDPVDVDKYADKIARYTMMDNAFMNAVFQNNLPAVQCLVSAIITDRKLEIVSFDVQMVIQNIYGHSTIMDIRAIDQDGVLYNIEIQHDPRGAHPLRLRYYSSLLDVHALERSEEYMNLPEKYVIFITDGDRYNEGKEIYHFTMQSEGDDSPIHCGDKQHYIIIDVNGNSDTDLGRVLHDLREPDPAKMYNEEFATRAKHLKLSQEGRKVMTTVTDELIQEGIEQGIEQGIERGTTIERKKSIRAVLAILKNLSVPKKDAVKNLTEQFGMTEAEASQAVDKAWAA